MGHRYHTSSKAWGLGIRSGGKIEKAGVVVDYIKEAVFSRPNRAATYMNSHEL